MCDCYKIGGPFIAEDPACPVHGTEAQCRREQEETEQQTLEDRIARLELVVENQDRLIRNLMEMVHQTGNE